jgi:hypothetical protein
MAITLNKNRVFSSLLALVYIVIGFLARGGEGGFIMFGFVILPLICIWYSDAMGGFTGIAGDIGITRSSPGLFVCIAGWILLLLPVLIEIIVHVAA